jgi:hypothetical protein
LPEEVLLLLCELGSWLDPLLSLSLAPVPVTSVIDSF